MNNVQNFFFDMCIKNTISSSSTFCPCYSVFIIFAGKRECKFSSNTILWQFPALPFCNFPWKIYFIGSVYIQHPLCLSLSCAINNDAWRECAIKQQN